MAMDRTYEQGTRRGLQLALVSLMVVTGLGRGASTVEAQSAHVERLPGDALDVAAPTERVAGEAGQMRVTSASCPSLPLATARRRIVDTAVQEWAYFGFSVTDRTVERDRFSWSGSDRDGRPRRSWRSRGVSPQQVEAFLRVAPSIAGYWAATPDGAWMLDRQNDRWTQAEGNTARWRDPWSAAFISWVLCESGVGQMSQFQRSIAHRDYVDQAIRARDGRAPEAAYVAYEMGEAAIGPGDLLCSGTRSGYETVDQRRGQLGRGARMHCDIVVAMDEPAGIILAIGGNVYGTVSLKRLPAVRSAGPELHPHDDFFGHLRLRADPIEADALSTSVTVRALDCASGFAPPSQVEVLNLSLGTAACQEVNSDPSGAAPATRLPFLQPSRTGETS